MFRPITALPTNVETIQSIDTAKVADMSPEELADHRLSIIVLRGHLDAKLAETAAKKELAHDEAEICAYIAKILEDGFNLVSTPLGAEPRFRDAQMSKAFRDQIGAAVVASPFSEKKFKVKELRFQRGAIARSKSIHELRQNVDLMIGPLKIHRELEAMKASAKAADKAEMTEIAALLEEIDAKDAKITDQARVLSEMSALYDPDADEIDLLRQIEEFKTVHQCSDREAARVFRISERSIRRLRSRYRQQRSKSCRPALTMPVAFPLSSEGTDQDEGLIFDDFFDDSLDDLAPLQIH